MQSLQHLPHQGQTCLTALQARLWQQQAMCEARNTATWPATRLTCHSIHEGGQHAGDHDVAAAAVGAASAAADCISAELVLWQVGQRPMRVEGGHHPTLLQKPVG